MNRKFICDQIYLFVIKLNIYGNLTKAHLKTKYMEILPQ